jgi:3-phenylpropionate/trans-cinnamate dioxygenase ferredoxin reductase subunit
MSQVRRSVLIGASLSGAKAAETLRSEGFADEIVLVGDEPVRPYERPTLSKTYLQGIDSSPVFVHDEAFYADHAIDLRLSTRVVNLDVAAKEVTLESGERLGYETALLATGAQPRLLTTIGVEGSQIDTLRTVADADRLRAAITPGRHVVVIGAGWIGCEVAASARLIGAEVTVIEMGNVPLERVLGPELGAFYRDVHLEHGVTMRLGVGVESFRSSDPGVEVRLTDGSVVTGDLVVAGVGVLPRTELAVAAGIEVDNGVLTDEFLATSAPGVYAAGDVANVWHPKYGHRIRLEHWAAALDQGPVAARNMLGIATPWEKLPYFYSDQYDIGMEYVGLASASDEVLFRGDPATREFIAFWIRDERVVAGMNVNVWDVSETIGEIISRARTVDRSRLADPSVDLAGLVPPGAD